MGVFSPGGSIPGTISGTVTVAGASNPAITVVPMALAATEYSILLPTDCKQFLVKLRSGARLQVSYVSGQSGTIYLEIPRYCFYAESDLGLGSAVTLYFQSPVAAQELEVLTWV